jgi:hypothetical protein
MPPARGILLVTFLAVVGCQPRRPDFMSRVREDCAAGDRWACDLLDRLGHPEPGPPIGSPHPRRDALLLLADGIGVDRCGGELGVSQPLLHQVQRDAGRDGGDAETVP